MAQQLYSDDRRIMLPKLNKTQEEFLWAKEPFVCLSGGYGSGKTTAGVWRCIMLSISSERFGDLSGNVGLMGRFKLADFEKTTLPELMKWMPRPWIRRVYSKDGRIELINESVIHFTHLESYEHLQSFNLGWAFIDQMEQVPYDVFKALALERIRMMQLNKFTYREGSTFKYPVDPPVMLKYHTVFGACNPKRCWIHNTFVRNEMYRKSNEESIRTLYKPNYRLIESSTYENEKNLPAGYIDRQRMDKSDREFKRSVMGSWDVFEGQVYEDFTDDMINKENIVPHPSWPVYVGIDHGGTGAPGPNFANNTTGVIFFALEPRDGDYPVMHVYDELFLPSSTIDETVAAIDDKLKGHMTASRLAYPEWYRNMPNTYGQTSIDVAFWRCDPSMMRRRDDSDETLMETYMRFASNRGMDMAMSPGNNDVSAGIQKLSWMFRRKLVRVNPRCKWWSETFKSFEYGKNETPAANQNDHLETATRYAASAMPIWFAEFSLPEQSESVTQRHMRKLMNATGSMQQDSVYGNYFAR